MEERRKLAGTIHCWRDAVGGDTLLQQLPPSFDWFQKHFILRPLIKTEQGHVVVLLKVSVAARMHLQDFPPCVQCAGQWIALFSMLKHARRLTIMCEHASLKRLRQRHTVF